MPVARIRVERDVGYKPKVRELALDRAAGAADEVAFVEGFASLRVLEHGLGIGEERDRRDLELDRPPGLAQSLVDAQPFNARHCSNRHAALFAIDEKKRPDEVARRQHMFGHQSPSIPPCGCGAGGW